MEGVRGMGGLVGPVNQRCKAFGSWLSHKLLHHVAKTCPLSDPSIGRHRDYWFGPLGVDVFLDSDFSWWLTKPLQPTLLR